MAMTPEEKQFLKDAEDHYRRPTGLATKLSDIGASIKSRAGRIGAAAMFWKRGPVDPTLTVPDERPAHPKDDWVLSLIDKAVWFSTAGCLAFLTLYCLKFVGRIKFDIKIDWSNTQPFLITYDLATSLDLLPLAALAFVSIGIVCFAKAWVTLFAEEPFSNWVTKWGSLLLGISTSVVIIMGSMTVNQDVRQEDYRASMVTEEKVANSKAGEEARIKLRTDELARMQAKPSYQGLAASAGVESWTKKIAMTPETDANYKQISRAITDAEAADKLKAEIEAMTVAVAVGTTTAEVKADVGAEMHDDVTSMVRQSVVWRMPLMAAVMDVILIFGPFMAKNRRRRMLAAWATWQPGITVGMPRMRASDLEYPWENFTPWPARPAEPAATPEPEPAPTPAPAPEPIIDDLPPAPDPVPPVEPEPVPPAKPAKPSKLRQRALPAPTADECAALGLEWTPDDAGTPVGGQPDTPDAVPQPNGDDDDGDTPDPADGADAPDPNAPGEPSPAPAAEPAAPGTPDGDQAPQGMDTGRLDQGDDRLGGDHDRDLDTGGNGPLGDPSTSDDVTDPGDPDADDLPPVPDDQFTWDTPDDDAPDPDDTRMDDDGGPPRQTVGA